LVLDNENINIKIKIEQTLYANGRNWKYTCQQRP